MKTNLSIEVVLVSLTLWAIGAHGQTSTNVAATNTTAAVVATNAPPPAPPKEKEKERWEFSFSAIGYVVPDSRDYVQPTITADRGWLHLEGRYNYEALDTASLWVGYNLSVGDRIKLDITPMVGGVFGDLRGVAPGFRFNLEWWRLNLYSEGEYVIDTSDSSGDFFYSWSELTIQTTRWLRLGIVGQRTQAYHTDRDVQRGFIVGVSLKRISATAYIFNPDESKPTLAGSIALKL